MSFEKNGSKCTLYTNATMGGSELDSSFPEEATFTGLAELGAVIVAISL